MAVILFALGFAIAPGYAGTNAMTITLPENVIRQSLQDILPLNLDEPNKHIEGRLTIDSISKLKMGENSAVIQGMIIGRNLTIVTQVSNQDLRIKVGNLQLPLTCDLTFRYDADAKVLYVTPRLRRPAPGSLTDKANSVTSLLTLFNNREYPVSLTSLKTLDAKVGDQDISLDMEPVDIRVTKGNLIVKMVPRLTKTD